RSNLDSPPPLSFAQQRVWFLSQLYPDSVFYNITTSVELEGELKVEQLCHCFNSVISRHEALRTSFSTSNSQPVQIIHAYLSLRLRGVDLNYLPRPLLDREVESLTRQEAQEPFDLIQGPLIRAKLLKVAERGHLLLLSMHHIVSDGWSIGVLIKEVGELY